MGHHEASTSHYVKIWAVLLVLLVISVIGPHIGAMLEIKAITLITAFGIAIVKALLVAKHFMHITLEKKLVTYVVLAMLVCNGIFLSGTVVDVMRHSGSNWVKTYDENAAKAALEHQSEMEEKEH